MAFLNSIEFLIFSFVMFLISVIIFIRAIREARALENGERQLGHEEAKQLLDDLKKGNWRVWLGERKPRKKNPGLKRSKIRPS